MSEAIWAAWYDLAEGEQESFTAWSHQAWLPWLRQQPGVAWVAQYRNVGHGPALATYHDIAGHAPDNEMGTGGQFVVLAGAASSHTFYQPLLTTRPLPPGFDAMLGQRRGLREAVLVEEARVNGPSLLAREPGGAPAPAIQFGSYRIRNVEEEIDIECWYAQQRFPLMARMPGSVLTRKFVTSFGWAKHAVLYEFESLDARTRQFEEPHESKVVDVKEWTGRIVRTTLHTPGPSSASESGRPLPRPISRKTHWRHA
jgi:hypothetical protein